MHAYAHPIKKHSLMGNIIYILTLLQPRIAISRIMSKHATIKNDVNRSNNIPGANHFHFTSRHIAFQVKWWNDTKLVSLYKIFSESARPTMENNSLKQFAIIRQRIILLIKTVTLAVIVIRLSSRTGALRKQGAIST